jgi:release factor glutamine methyltransferase
MTDLAAWLEMGRQSLANLAEQPSIEAQAMLAAATRRSREWIFAHGETRLSAEELEKLNQWLTRRLAGEPLPYLVGHWDFYGLEMCVSPAVLIPRPETELLVDLAREWLQVHPERRWAVDVGTGSGCIAAALLNWTPDLKIIASDRSWAALELAQSNLKRLGLAERARCIQADLLCALNGPFDLICANLPYIPTSTLAELEVNRHEPNLALDGGEDGLRLIEPLLEQAVTRLAPGGRIVLEIEISQELAAPALAAKYFPRAKIELKPDLSGLPRMVVIDGSADK